MLPARAAAAPVDQLPDLRTIIPTDAFSVAQGTSGPEFRYTHMIFDAGPGPLEIQPQYNQSSGQYQGYQQEFAKDSATGAWTLAREVPVADSFIFHAVHGHFHFPMASFGLYTVAGDGGVGAPVAMSPKNGFCIADSFMYDTTVPNAGKFIGTQGSCANPATLRGLTVGAVDEYDYRDPGQAIPITGVPDGTYWFRAISDPNNDLVEADESNNETDVLVTIANGVVTPGTVTHPDTTPPAITIASPGVGDRLVGTVKLSATTGASGGVQFLVDGSPVGAGTANGGSYDFNWDTTSIVDGTHWIAARSADSQGRVGTSPVITVNVANNSPLPQPGVLATDGKVSVEGRGPVTAPALTTTQSGDVLLAFVSSDGPTAGGQTATVSGGGLTWSLVKRANTRLGTSEIWKTTAPTPQSGLRVTSLPAKGGYDQSLTVIAFSGAGGVGGSASAGAVSGAPQVNVTTTAAGGWVFGVGNDWDRALGRVVPSDQTMQHQAIDTISGDTFWVQSQTNPTGTAGTSVPINDTSPTGDQWNLAAVEVVPGTAPPADTSPPQVTMTDPADGSTVSGTIPVAATAADNVGVTKVQFYLDGQPLGSAVTAAPFKILWDTRTASAGAHTITAVASDAATNAGTSAAVHVTVDNSVAPPATITIDRQVNQRAKGTLNSPGLTTSSAGEQLLAFVSLDGPNSAGSQTATVTGGGLTWSLVERSNTQAGDSEVWAAKAGGTLSNAVITATPQRPGYDGMLTVIAFKNGAGPNVAGHAGAASGAPDIYLPGIPAASWVFAAGNDWDRAVARTPVAGQVLQQQWIDTKTGDTFWVQSTTAPSTSPGLVTIHDDAPTNDRWNYVAVEETAAPGP